VLSQVGEKDTSLVIAPLQPRLNPATSVDKKAISYVLHFAFASSFDLSQSRNCTESTNTSATYSSASGAECYKCGKVGHIARSCPESGSGGYGAFNSGGGGGSGGGGSQKTWYVFLIYLCESFQTHPFNPATLAAVLVISRAIAFKDLSVIIVLVLYVFFLASLHLVLITL